jgi:hypothetical protein
MSLTGLQWGTDMETELIRPKKKKKKSKEELRQSIVALEATMKAMPAERQIHIEPKHYFANGLYMREIFIPKGVTLTGKIHKTEHLCVLSQGEVSVYTDEGMKRIKASTVVKSSPGTKRVLFAHQDSIWINAHFNPSNETDLHKIESHFVAETFLDYYLSSDRTFDDVLKCIGFTAEELTIISERTEDQIPFDKEPECIRIAESPIHGKGVFATRLIQRDEHIAQARVGTKRTPVGRYCNHGSKPNAEMIMQPNGDVFLIASRDIQPGEEILSDYFLNYTNTRLQIEGGK